METKLSQSTLLKFINNELPVHDMNRVRLVIDNSKSYQKIIMELNATYSLIADKRALENNPYLYIDLIEKITNKEVKKNSHNALFTKRVLRPLIAVSLILITLLNGYIMMSIHSEPREQQTTLNYNKELHFNDLQIEKIELLLLTKEPK